MRCLWDASEMHPCSLGCIKCKRFFWEHEAIERQMAVSEFPSPIFIKNIVRFEGLDCALLGAGVSWGL